MSVGKDTGTFDTDIKEEKNITQACKKASSFNIEGELNKLIDLQQDYTTQDIIMHASPNDESANESRVAWHDWSSPSVMYDFTVPSEVLGSGEAITFQNEQSIVLSSLLDDKQKDDNNGQNPVLEDAGFLDSQNIHDQKRKTDTALPAPEVTTSVSSVHQCSTFMENVNVQWSLIKYSLLDPDHNELSRFYTWNPTVLPGKPQMSIKTDEASSFFKLPIARTLEKSSGRRKRSHSTCTICCKSFSHGWVLKKHLKVHTSQDGVPLCVCPIEDCKAGFRFQSTLNKHVKEMHKKI